MKYGVMAMGNKNSNLKAKVLSGLIWTFGERIIAQGVSFIVSIILARILAPDQYGAVAILLVFINLANVFVSSGFGESLVKKSDSNETDFSTMFYCSFVCSWILYLVLFIGAPYIATFYRIPLLTNLLRVFSLKIPISSISTVQHAYVSKHMIYKKFFFSTLGGTLVSGAVGIFMAYHGFGAWALVMQYLTNTTIGTLVLFFTVPWRPRRVFDKDSAGKLLSYGWKITASSLINALYIEMRSLIIGRVYSAEDLAYYNRGNQFPSLIITNVDSAIGKVMFPAMAKVSDSAEHLKDVSRRALKTTSYVVFPLMTGLLAVAEPLVRLLLTEKWLFCVPYLQCSCFYYMCQPIQTTNWQIIKASGRSDLCLKLEIVKKIIGVGIIVATMNYGVKAIAIGNAGFAAVSMIINTIPNKKLIEYSIGDQIKDLFPAISLSVFMGSTVWLVSLLPIKPLLMLVLQVLLGMTIYIGSSLVFRVESFDYLFGALRRFVPKKTITIKYNGSGRV